MILSGTYTDQFVEVFGQSVMEADGLYVELEKPADDVQTGGVRVTNCPAGARWSGGHIVSRNPVTFDYDLFSDIGNGGAGIRIRACPSFVLERIRIENLWDPARFEECANPTVKECYIIHARDDGIEAEESLAVLNTLSIVRCYFKNTHTVFSTRPGSEGTVPAHHVYIEDCLISMAEDHVDTRAKRDYPWNDGDTGHGTLWKTRNAGQNLTLTLVDCIIRLDALPKTDKSAHEVFPRGASAGAGSGGNILVWLGPQTADGNGGIPVVAVPKIGGGTISVPETLRAHLEPAASMFTFTDSLSVWTAAETVWLTDVWGKASRRTWR